MERHLAIYVRVSTAAQKTESQEPELKQWAEGQKERVVWYRDKETGTTMNRPGWNKLVEAMRAGKVIGVVCWRLDRLGRNVSGLASLFEDLIGGKINLVSLKDGIDLSTSAGRLIAHVLASVAQYETEVRGERVLAGQAVARAKGKRWGGSTKGRLIKVKPEQVTVIRRMKAEGTKIAAIARATGLTRPTVYHYLRAV